MDKKPLYELIIGGGYLSQPKHKPNAIPDDFLARFYNVKTSKIEEIEDFANNYAFTEYIIPDSWHSIREIQEKFVEIHKRYSPIIDELLKHDRIKYHNILKINADLEKTSPKISFRGNANSSMKREEGFSIYTMKSDSNEKAFVEVVPFGTFESGKFDPNTTRIQVKISRPANSDSKWQYIRIEDGVKNIIQIFPSENWKIGHKYLPLLVLADGKINLDSKMMPISIEMNFRIRKSIFNRQELVAVWSPVDGSSFVAKRIWDYINTRQDGDKYKNCEICGNYHKGKSIHYCNKPECYLEWDSRRKKPKKIKLK
ncbi:MAG: hypothetical protein PHE56_14890 [Bacteroidales bacterium]|nr:hypothetical protein [Bacteroidales bacterium]